MAAQTFGVAARNCAGGPEMLLSRCPKGAPRLCSGLTKENFLSHTRRPHTDPLRATFPDDTRSFAGCSVRNTLVPLENSPSQPQMNRLFSVLEALCRLVADLTFACGWLVQFGDPEQEMGGHSYCVPECLGLIAVRAESKTRRVELQLLWGGLQPHADI